MKTKEQNQIGFKNYYARHKKDKSFLTKRSSAGSKYYAKDSSRVIACNASRELKKFLTACGISSIYHIADVPVATLEKIAGGWGWPDWKEEGVEEKTKNDWLRSAQWARSYLEYRAGRSYKVALRRTRTESQMFENVLDFYDFQQK